MQGNAIVESREGLFRRGRPPLPLWTRLLIAGWLLGPLCFAFSAATSGLLARCSGSCPASSGSEATALQLVAVLMVGGWTVLPALVVAGIRWWPVRLGIAILATAMTVVAVAANLGGPEQLRAYHFLWPLTIALAGFGLYGLRSSAGARPTRREGLASAAFAVLLIYVLLEGAMPWLRPYAIVVVLAVAALALARFRGWPWSPPRAEPGHDAQPASELALAPAGDPSPGPAVALPAVGVRTSRHRRRDKERPRGAVRGR